MNIFAKPKQYKNFIQDKDAAFAASAPEMAALSDDEIATQANELSAMQDDRLGSDTSIEDAYIAGRLQAINAEMRKRASAQFKVEDTERYFR
jgi:hypothetical protein